MTCEVEGPGDDFLPDKEKHRIVDDDMQSHLSDDEVLEINLSRPSGNPIFG